MPTARFHNALPGSRGQVRQLIESHQDPVVQFDNEPAPSTLDRLDLFCEEFGPGLQVRFCGFGWREFDTSILRRLPHVASLSIDTVRSISSFAPIAELDRLTRLRFGVHEHPDGCFLRELELDRFTHLTLAENKRRNFDLSPLAGARSLTQLFIQGHDRGIGKICTLPHLSDLTLSGFPKHHDLAFLNDLAALRSLFLILGSRTSIAEFGHPDLRTLRIVWVRLLEELGPLQRFSKLEELEIEDQLRLTELDIRGLRLRSLVIANCKMLAQITGLRDQSQLEHLSILGTKVPAVSRANREPLR